jgi:hypothetical protein
MALLSYLSDARVIPGVLAAFTVALGGAPVWAQTPAAASVAANTTAPAATPPARRGKPAKPKKPPKDAAPDEASAIAAGKEACGEIGETYAKEHWRAQNQRGVWRVWVTPVHCEDGGTCPTYEVHITVSDGVPGACTQRIALY